jgi:hypothetical protein
MDAWMVCLTPLLTQVSGSGSGERAVGHHQPLRTAGRLAGRNGTAALGCEAVSGRCWDAGLLEDACICVFSFALPQFARTAAKPQRVSCAPAAPRVPCSPAHTTPRACMHSCLPRR